MSWPDLNASSVAWLRFDGRDMCFELHAHERLPGRMGHLTSTNVPERLALEIVSVVRPTSNVLLIVYRTTWKAMYWAEGWGTDNTNAPCGRWMGHDWKRRLQE